MNKRYHLNLIALALISPWVGLQLRVWDTAKLSHGDWILARGEAK